MDKGKSRFIITMEKYKKEDLERERLQSNFDDAKHMLDALNQIKDYVRRFKTTGDCEYCVLADLCDQEWNSCPEQWKLAVELLKPIDEEGNIDEMY